MGLGFLTQLHPTFILPNSINKFNQRTTNNVPTAIMELAPPSYENATLTDYWDIVANYMPSRDLTAAALVCSRWHSTFAPHIWGNPASHFGIENDRVYVALTRFSRNLQTARLLVRSLTHTLHMPPAHAEIYNGPHTDWLRDMLERLPNLQSLIVRGLPFFDHGALQALGLIRKQAVNDNSPPPGVFELPASTGSLYHTPSASLPSFGLRLLDASRCPNVTSNGLAAALGRFESLLYLDLSFTYPARSSTALHTLSKCTGLQVLKIRGISLRDNGIETLCRAIGRRVRSLDIRDNELTDHSVRQLLDSCFAHHIQADGHHNVLSGQRSPALLPYLGSEMLEVYQGEDFEGYLRHAFTGRFVSRLAIEDTPPGGLTHLYISGNALTVEGVSALVRSDRLHVLDAGTIARRSGRRESSSSQPSSLDMPDCEKLTPVLAKHAAESMTFLRIEHTLVTKEASHSDIVVPGRVELADTALPEIPRHVAELGSTSFQPEAHEMGVDQPAPRYELPGDPVQLVISSTPDDTFHISELAEPADHIRRGSAFAPEVVDEIDAMANRMARESMLSPASALEDTTDSNSSTSMPSLGHNSSVLPTTRPRTYSAMATDRRARLTAYRTSGHSLHPAMLSHVTTLVLTDVPPFSADRGLADRIICFIKACAEEASMARSEAMLDYSLPPGRRGHASALRHSATKLFALKRLVLELAPVDRSGKGGSPWQHLDTKSMTEDRDSEKLWSASETDFSFFGEEECVFPTLETGRPSFLSGSNDKEVSFGQSVPTSARIASQKPMVDNVAMISEFRKERKLAHQRSLAAGHVGAETEGLWNGIVQVVRCNNALRNDEEMDYYGNMFTNNYLYR